MLGSHPRMPKFVSQLGLAEQPLSRLWNVQEVQKTVEGSTTCKDECCIKRISVFLNIFVRVQFLSVSMRSDRSS